jgi:hypothetical protein
MPMKNEFRPYWIIRFPASEYFPAPPVEQASLDKGTNGTTRLERRIECKPWLRPE